MSKMERKHVLILLADAETQQKIILILAQLFLMCFLSVSQQPIEGIALVTCFHSIYQNRNVCMQPMQKYIHFKFSELSCVAKTTERKAE